MYKKIEELDQRQKIWLRLYVVWLIYNLKSFVTFLIEVLSTPELPEELEEFEELIRPMMNLGILIQFGILFVTLSPYLIQLWAIYKKSLKRTNTFIKIMKVLIVLNAISLAFSCVIVYQWDKMKEMINSGMFMISEEEMEMLNMYSKEDFMMSTFYEMAEMLVYFLLSYGGAVKYRNYLMQRENLMQKTNKVE